MCEQHLSEEERAHTPTGPVAFVDELVVALTNGRIYSGQHPRVQASLDSLHECLIDMLQGTNGRTIAIGASDGFLFFERRPLLGATLSAQRLIEPLTTLSSGGLAFDPSTTREDLATFVRMLGRSLSKLAHFEEANAALVQEGCASIRLLPEFQEGTTSWTDVVEAQLAAKAGSEGDGDGGGAGHASHSQGGGADGVKLDLDFDLPIRFYQDVVAVMQEAMLKACQGHNIDTSRVSGMVESILAQLRGDSKALLSLSRYEKYDAFTFGHSIRVCLVALNFAQHLTRDTQVLQRIGLAALLHDIGKARIPYEVLHSTQRLSDEERIEMNMHTVHGGQILLEGPAPDPLAVAVAFSHHQNADGSGYPASIRCGPQSPATMIVKIADVYEALTAVRPYKPPMSSVRAYRIMMDMKAHFDPALLRRFITTNGMYPIGSHVKLSTGQVARVDQQTDSILEPVVTTVREATGTAIRALDADRIDLRERPGTKRVRIEGAALDGGLATAA